MKKWFLVIMVSFALMTSSVAHAENEGFTKFGDITQIALPITAGMFSLIAGDYEGVFQAVEGALYTTALTHALKYAINSERPNGSGLSFPSGHTSAATQGAAYLQFRYGYTVGIPAYFIAGIVGYSRIQSEYHHWYDVVGGMALATGVQFVVTKLEFSLTNYFIMPLIEGDTYGLVIGGKF